MNQKLKNLIIALTIALGLALPATAVALTAKDCASGSTEVNTVTDSSGKSHKETVCAPLGSSSDANPIWNDLNNIVDALSAGVGVVVVGTIIVGGIQYTVAGDQSGKVEEAKARIANGIFALVAFFLTWAFLQWLIPGGVFNS